MLGRIFKYKASWIQYADGMQRSRIITTIKKLQTT
jgi:hypothetical protein